MTRTYIDPENVIGSLVITSSPGDITLLLVAVVDVRHLNDASNLDNPVLEHLGVHLNPRVNQAFRFAQRTFPRLILVPKADYLKLVRVLRFLLDNSSVQHAVVDVRLVIRCRVNVGHAAWRLRRRAGVLRHFVLVGLHVSPVKYGCRVINLLIAGERQYTVIPIRHDRRRIAYR